MKNRYIQAGEQFVQATFGGICLGALGLLNMLTQSSDPAVLAQAGGIPFFGYYAAFYGIRGAGNALRDKKPPE